jgi:hypothetical protein
MNLLDKKYTVKSLDQYDIYMDKLQNIAWDGKSDPSTFINEYKDIQTTLTLLVKHYQEPHQSLQATALLKRIPDDKDLGTLLVIKENIKHNYDEDTLTVKIVEDKLQQWWASYKDKSKHKGRGYYDRGRSKSPHYNKDKDYDKGKTTTTAAATTTSSKEGQHTGYKNRQYSKERYRSRSNSRNRYNNNNGYRSRSNSYNRGKSPSKNKPKEESDSSSSESSGGEDNTSKQSANANTNKSQSNAVSAASSNQSTNTNSSTQSDPKNTGKAVASFCNLVKCASSSSKCISAPSITSKQENHEDIYYTPKYNEALADSASAVMLTPRIELLTDIKDLDNSLTITTLAGEKHSTMEGKMVLKNGVEFNKVKYLKKIDFTVLSIGQICNNENYIAIFTKKGGYVVDSKIINEDEVSKKSVLKFEKKGTLYVTKIAEDETDQKSKLKSQSATKYPFATTQSHGITIDSDESDEKSNAQSDNNTVMKEYSPKSLQEY